MSNSVTNLIDERQQMPHDLGVTYRYLRETISLTRRVRDLERELTRARFRLAVTETAHQMAAALGRSRGSTSSRPYIKALRRHYAACADLAQFVQRHGQTIREVMEGQKR